MAIVKPFRAIRPAEDKASQVAALPYDVYDREEACAEVADKPLSFLNIDRAETQFPASVGTYDECVYEKAAEMLQARISEGVFFKEQKPCYYIYELTMDGRTQTGLVACSSIDDYITGIVKKHENTRADKEADRIHHVDTTDTQTGPIFLAYREIPEISALIAKEKAATAPVYDFVSEDGIRHAVWVISDDASVKSLEALFEEKVPYTYIADGHHRAASAVRVGVRRREQFPDYNGSEEFNYFLSVLFPDEQLMIMPYNRYVKDLNGFTPETFMERISKEFEVRSLAESEEISPAAKGSFGMYMEHKWYRLTARPEIMKDDAVDGLDVSVLQNELLGPVLGIEDPKTDHRIEFIGGIRGNAELERKVNETDHPAVAFSMYPTSISKLLAVADASRLMPPKSTWFEPKLRSGLFLHALESNK